MKEIGQRCQNQMRESYDTIRVGEWQENCTEKEKGGMTVKGSGADFFKRNGL